MFWFFVVVNEFVIIYVYYNSVISCNYKLWELDGCIWFGFFFEVDSEVILNWGGGCFGFDYRYYIVGYNLRIRYIMLLYICR